MGDGAKARCPMCDSPQPEWRRFMQRGGEVWRCDDAYHEATPAPVRMVEHHRVLVIRRKGGNK